MSDTSANTTTTVRAITEDDAVFIARQLIDRKNAVRRALLEIEKKGLDGVQALSDEIDLLDKLITIMQYAEHIIIFDDLEYRVNTFAPMFRPNPVPRTNRAVEKAFHKGAAEAAEIAMKAATEIAMKAVRTPKE